jgi:uroporphyrinogen decarboxylase
MALDPDWVKDMVMTFADFTLRHLEVLFAEEGKPDAMWFYEDMGFKEKPFMSPAMYKEIVEPGHKKLFDFSHDLGLKVIVHSCGFVEPLVPGLIRAGMNCLQAMEVKAGMDVRKLAKQFGDRISFCGGLDIRLLAANDRPAMLAEMRSKVLPVLKMGSGFIIHSDHSIPPEVDHETLHWFFQEGASLAREVWT